MNQSVLAQTFISIKTISPFVFCILDINAEWAHTHIRRVYQHLERYLFGKRIHTSEGLLHNHSVSEPVLNYHSYSLASHPFDPKVSVVQSLLMCWQWSGLSDSLVVPWNMEWSPTGGFPIPCLCLPQHHPHVSTACLSASLSTLLKCNLPERPSLTNPFKIACQNPSVVQWLRPML